MAVGVVVLSRSKAQRTRGGRAAAPDLLTTMAGRACGQPGGCGTLEGRAPPLLAGACVAPANGCSFFVGVSKEMDMAENRRSLKEIEAATDLFLARVWMG